MNFIITATTVAMLASGAAIAQEAAPGGDAILNGPGISIDAPSALPLKYVNVQSSDLLASRLIGVDIFNAQNESIGEISDVVIGEGKTVIGVVASVGGFIGLGESYVVIDPASISLSKSDGTWKAYVQTTKEDLTNAPKLDYTLVK